MNLHTFSRFLPAAVASIVLAGCAGPFGMRAEELRPCALHCQTHSEGYEWAQLSNLSDDRGCAGYTDAFARGCRDGVEDLRQLRPASQGI